MEGLQSRVQDTFSATYLDIRRQVGGVSTYVSVNNVVRTTRSSTDNPEAIPTSNIPVIQTIEVHMPLYVDVRNGDTLTVKHVDSKNQITDAFRGVAAAPYTNDGRKHVSFVLQALGRDDIINDVIPPPPIDTPEPNEYSVITTEFVDTNGVAIRAPIVYNAIKGKELTIEALALHGWDFSHTEFRDNVYDVDVVAFTPSEPAYTVRFVYEAVTYPLYLRPFFTGRYRRTDGTLVTTGNLAHWYRRVDFNWQGETAGVMTVTIGIPPLSTTGMLRHSETAAMIQFRQGLRVRIFPQDIFAELRSAERVGSEFVVTMIQVEPTEMELSAPITKFYDGED